MTSPSSLTRRDFIHRSLIAAAAIPSVSSVSSLAAPSHQMTIGLSQYSLRDLFASKQLDPLDYPAFAKKEFGLTDLDLWEGGLPKERLDDDQYLSGLKQRATDVGTNLFLLMGGVADATGKADPKAAELTRTIERSAVLGCQYARFFLRATEGDRTAAVTRCVEALTPLADLGKASGITLAIEPGASKATEDGAFLAEVMKQLNHPHCRLMPDFGKLRGDIYEGTRAMMPYAAVISAKSHEFDADGNQVDFDYPRLIQIIAEASFKGIIAIEWEGKNLEPAEGVHATKKLIERALAAL